MISLWIKKNGIIYTLFAQMPAHHSRNDALLSGNEWDSGLVSWCP